MIDFYVFTDPISEVIKCLILISPAIFWIWFKELRLKKRPGVNIQQTTRREAS